MNWWGLLVVALGGLLIGVTVAVYANEPYRKRLIRSRQRAFGWLFRSKDEAWFARDYRRGTVGVVLVGVLVIAIGIVMIVHG